MGNGNDSDYSSVNHVKHNQNVAKIESVCYLLYIQSFMFVYMCVIYARA